MIIQCALDVFTVWNIRIVVLWHCVVQQVGANVLEEHASSVFRVEICQVGRVAGCDRLWGETGDGLLEWPSDQ
jgi:hypothetical protein